MILFCGRYEEDSECHSCYFESVICLNHIVESIDRQVIIHNFFFVLTFLVGVFEVDVDYFLYLPTTLLDLQVTFIDLINHLTVEFMIFVPLKGVFI